MTTLDLHRIQQVRTLIEQLKPETWAYNYWRGVLTALQQPMSMPKHFHSRYFIQ